MTNPFQTIDERLSNIECLLLDIKHKPQSAIKSDADELLTVEQAGKFLSLTVPTIYSLISKKAIPFMKRSKRCYFTKADLLSYIKAGKSKTKDETSLAVDELLSKKKGSNNE